MSYLNILKKSRNSDTTVLQYFFLNFRRKDNCIHAFFEGRDDPSFYSNYFENNLPENYIFKIYKCNNKKSVYYVYDQLKSRSIPKELTLFFVDKDLSDYLGESWDNDFNIFTTKYYSIENYMVNESVLKRVLIELYGIEEGDATLKYIINQFSLQLHRFYRLFTPLYAYMMLKKIEGCSVFFNNIKLNKIFNFTDKAVIKKNISEGSKIQHINKVCSIDSNNIDRGKFCELLSDLRSKNPKTFIRGKFELWFLVIFVKTFFNYLKSNGIKYKSPVEMGNNNATQILGPRVKQPKELKDFFDNIIDMIEN